MPNIKLTYWHIPGRAEVTRLLLTLGDTPFTDNRIEFKEWSGDRKLVAPFHQVPYIEIDGQVFAESAAINQWAANLVGLLPKDPLKAALADQVTSLVEDSAKTAAHTHNIADKQQRVAARQTLLVGPDGQPGPLAKRLQILENLMANSPGIYVAGDQFTYGDLAAFNHLCTLKSGLWDGIPVNVLDSYPALKAFRNVIACIPKITAYYAQATDETRINGYRPDP